MYDDIIPGPQLLAVEFNEELAGLQLKTGVRPDDPAALFVIGDIVGSLNILQSTELQVSSLIGEMQTMDDGDNGGDIEDAISVLEYAGAGIINKLKSFGIGDEQGNFNYDLTDNHALENGFLLEKAAPRDWML